jgi:hypothetical protein
MINSKIKFLSQANYYNSSSQAVGSGPIPPQVGQTTTYKINWKVINTTNTLTAVIVKAILTNNVVWVDSGQADTSGSIDYNSATREVSWQISNLGAENDKQVEVNSSFSVSVTPTDSEKGRVLTLLNPSTLSGVDGFTQENISVTQPALTTNLDGDPVAEGKGVVK